MSNSANFEQNSPNSPSDTSSPEISVGADTLSISPERKRSVASLLVKHIPEIAERIFLQHTQNKVAGTIENINPLSPDELSGRFARFPEVAFLEQALQQCSAEDEQLEVHLQNLLHIEGEIRGPVFKNGLFEPRPRHPDLTVLGDLARNSPDIKYDRLWERIVREWKSELIQDPSFTLVTAQRYREMWSSFEDIFSLSAKHEFESIKEEHRDQLKKLSHAFKEIHKLSNEFGVHMSGFDAAAAIARNHSQEPLSVIADHLQTYCDAGRKAHEQGLDPDLEQKVASIFLIYAKTHLLTPDAVEGLGVQLVEDLRQNKPDIRILNTLAGGPFSGKKGKFGVGDFVCHCYAHRVSPTNLHEELLALRDPPSTNEAHYEQNRRDGLTIARTFRGLRDRIHAQSPGTHDLMTEMAQYYETGDESGLRELMDQLEDCGPDIQQGILDRTRYDRDVPEFGARQQIKVIDVIRRLAKNTESVLEDPPETPDDMLNRKMKDVRSAIGEEIPTDVKAESALCDALEYLNKKLEKAMESKQIGIEPSVVQAIAWMERQSAKKLRSLSFERASGMRGMPWFHEIVRFQELTSSPNEYNKAEVDAFIAQVSNAGSAEQASKMISDRTFEHLYALSKKYMDQGRPDWNGALWSGNTSYQLTIHPAFRNAESLVGERAKKEQSVPSWMRNTGD